MKYVVKHNITEGGIYYPSGSILELTEQRARQLGDIITPFTFEKNEEQDRKEFKLENRILPGNKIRKNKGRPKKL